MPLGDPPAKVPALGPDALNAPLTSFFRGLVPFRTLLDKAAYGLFFFGCIFYVLCESGVFRFGRQPSFSCDDPLIQKPKLPEIVPTLILIPFLLIVPSIFLALLELRRNDDLAVDRPLSAGRVVRRYICGLVVAVIVVQALKEGFLEKRPHFLDACRPVSPSNRTLICDAHNPNRDATVTSYVCTGKKSHRAVTSFPSGHACTATYSCLFVASHLVKRGDTMVKSMMVRLTLVLLWVALGTFVSISRVWDNMHYWWDVPVGAGMGGMLAVVALRCPHTL